MISVKDLTKIYPSKSSVPAVALNEVSFDIKEKEFVSIVGKSGAGKTTLLKLILAEEEPTKGQIFFQGQDIGQIKRSKLPFLRQKLGVVFQDYKLFPSKTAYENVSYVMEVMGASGEEIERDVPKVLDLVGLSDKAFNLPSELSGGERQRVAIARAFVHRPDVILADEPTGNLDPYNTFDIIQLLIKIYEMGTTVVLATHDKEVINSLGKRVITLDQGRVVRDDKKGRFVL
ncbi:MAG: cell division ATP-binding protein FtsE [Candidatus Nealsonbacteria bacterium RIFOXYB1_FULL_40_15]|uniref:Cell division ATP-binding protein FtsE n=1 Tax=Candidatus Nealsonbacteria bacterium RIFOXYB1_FULL_40_15 TaxID=1801677 RepID=A0A1G2EP21_9BACT|nr:MAG: cell division ATP-binding protein FtsE [Candidatus Nealsonbacteria bacterium RIFOXYB1_FULL_40_15]OGZ28277.1 MAG: cell division ATP-binding protein FtsE [Candidatus Nealsonbacteria bacterium RIFOXYD1_FULL_39_11]